VTRQGWVAAFCLAAGVGALAACAPALAPAPVATAPRHPDFVFPATPPALASRDLVLRQQRGWQFLQAGDSRGARREFAAALKASAGFYPAETGLGLVSLIEHDVPDAIARFERTLRRAPQYVPALVARGDALGAAGRIEEAVRSFEAALGVDPSLADVKRRIEVLALRTQQEALTAARRAADAGHYEQARQAYERAIARSPESAFLYRELAGVERKQGAGAAALGHLHRATQLDPSDSRAWLQTGEVLEEQGDLAGAIDAYSKAEALEPGEETAARLARARAGAELARLPDAYRAIASSPQVTRGEVAALVGVRFRQLLSKAPARETVVLTDVRSHWAASWIMACVRAGVVEPYPNHTFQPRAFMRRLEMAQVVARVLDLAAQDRPGLSRRWAGESPRFGDLPPSHLGYPAAATAVSAGVMPVADGLFRPGRGMAGAEAVAIVERLEGLAR
jgi:predicted TPR repeat methyltransferase